MPEVAGGVVALHADRKKLALLVGPNSQPLLFRTHLPRKGYPFAANVWLLAGNVYPQDELRGVNKVAG